MYRKLISNSFIITIGSLGSKLIYFFLIPLYTAYLNPTEYGIADFLVTTVSLLLPLVSFSVYDAVFRFVLDRDENKESILKNAFVFTILCILVVALVIPVVLFLRIDQYYKNIFLLGFASLALQAVQSLLEQYDRGAEKITLYTISGIVAAVVVTLFSVIFLVQLHYKIYGYLIALILSNVAAISILATGVPFAQTAAIKLSPVKIKEMLRYSVPLIPNSIMWYLTNFASRYVLVFMLGVSESGIYAASSKIPGALSALIYVFINAWEISAVDTAQTEQNEVKNQFYSNIFEIFVAVTSIITAGMILFSRLIAFIFINHSYGPVWKFIPVLLLSNVFLSYSTFLGTNYIVEKKTNAVLKTTVYGAIANILVSMALVPLIGIMGACVGNAAGFFIVLVLRYHNLQKTNSLGINFKNAVINGLIVILMVLVMAFTQDLKIQIGLNVVLMLGLGLWNFKSLKLIFQQIWGKNK